MTISVIIPVYNAEEYLRKAVESANQFPEVVEIILCEDQSTDQSLALCESLEKEFSKVKLYQHPDKGNHGAAASRNLGLDKATQDFVAFLDADDYYLPNRFDEEKRIFVDEKIEGVFGAIGVEFLSEKGKKEFQEKFKIGNLTTVKHAAEGKDVFYGLLGLDASFGTFFHLNSLTIKTESLRKNNIRFNEKLRVHQDSDFIIKLAYHCYLNQTRFRLFLPLLLWLILQICYTHNCVYQPKDQLKFFFYQKHLAEFLKHHHSNKLFLNFH